MEKYVILADITCDLSAEMREAMGVKDYIRGHITIAQGGVSSDHVSDLDWASIPRDTFYDALNSKQAKVTSAPPNPDEYCDVFCSYIEQGYGVLSMSISGKISGTYDFACLGAKKALEKHPDAKLYCFDSMRMAGGFGLLVLYAHKLQAEGKSMEETIAWLEENRHRVHQMGPIDDLMVVARRGRIGMAKAIMGSFAGVKPMGDCDATGYVTVLTKAKGIRRALEMTAAYVAKTAARPEESYAVIVHTDRAQYAEDLCRRLGEAVPFLRVFVTESFPGSATNIGSGMIGVYYLGEPVSAELEAEKEIMREIAEK